MKKLFLPLVRLWRYLAKIMGRFFYRVWNGKPDKVALILNPDLNRKVQTIQNRIGNWSLGSICTIASVVIPLFVAFKPDPKEVMLDDILKTTNRIEQLELINHVPDQLVDDHVVEIRRIRVAVREVLYSIENYLIEIGSLEDSLSMVNDCIPASSMRMASKWMINIGVVMKQSVLQPFFNIKSRNLLEFMTGTSDTALYNKTAKVYEDYIKVQDSINKIDSAYNAFMDDKIQEFQSQEGVPNHIYISKNINTIKKKHKEYVKTKIWYCKETIIFLNHIYDELIFLELDYVYDNRKLMGLGDDSVAENR